MSYIRSRHVLARDDVDLVTLGEQLGLALGEPVALAAEFPSEDALGELVLYRAGTAAELPADEDIVAAVIRAHVPAPPVDEVDPLDELAEAAGKAKTVADLRTALVGFTKTEKARRRTGMSTR